MKNKGFTLIEILVVVAIIGVLSSMILVGLNTARKQGRDARRIADLGQVQNGLELYFQKNSAYPIGSPMTWAALTTALTGSAGPGGITQVPNDPLTTKTYFYGSDATGSSYVLGATLEDLGNRVLLSDIDGIVNGVNCGTAGPTDSVYCTKL